MEQGGEWRTNKSHHNPKKGSRLFPDNRLKIGVFITPPFESTRIGPLAPVISVAKIASRNLSGSVEPTRSIAFL